MKYIIVCLLLVQVVMANPYMSAILYDPPGPDEGNEWIEFYNPTNTSIDLSKYQLYKSNGRSDWQEISLQGVIPAQSYFLLGESNITADYITELSLVNIRGALKFTHNNHTLSLIGWGDLDNESFFQINPALPARDRPLVRVSDEFENRLSYIPTLHYTPSNSFFIHVEENQTQLYTVPTYFTISNAKPSLELVHVLSHELQENVVQYFPSQNQNVTLRVQLSDGNSISDLERLVITTNAYTKTRDLQFHSNETSIVDLIHIPLHTSLPQGMQNITLRLYDSQQAYHELYIPLHVIPTIGLEILDEHIGFSQYDDVYQAIVTLENTGSIPVAVSFTDPYIPTLQKTVSLTFVSNNTVIQPYTQAEITLQTIFTQPIQTGVYEANMSIKVQTT